MKRSLLALALALAFASGGSAAQNVPIRWDAGDRFRTAAPVPAGKSLEVCGKLGRGATVAWAFESGTALDFNIHYHAGKDVVFPVGAHSTAAEKGKLVAPLRQDYCWMWTNRGRAPAELTLALRRTRR